MAERPAPLVLVVTPREPREAAFGTYAAVASLGRGLLAREMSGRLGRLGAAVAALPEPAERSDDFHWGRWFAAAARDALREAAGPVDALGYVGAGALPLLGDEALDDLLSPVPGEAVANNRYSADAFAVAGELVAALAALETAPTDNSAPRALADAGIPVRDLGRAPFARFDVDTPLDLALLRLATRLPGVRRPDRAVAGFLEMARLPGGGGLEVPGLEKIGEVIRDREAELVVAGRIPAVTLEYLETQTACRVRAFVEERGMRSARGTGGAPRSLLEAFARRTSPSELVAVLAGLGDGVVLDSRVFMAARAGSADESAWPPEEERFAADFGEERGVATPWLRELVDAARRAPLPVLSGGHALVSDGLRIVVDAAWLGR